MIRTLIIEDELLARTGLRMLIDWKEYGFELLEDAVDGEEALERIISEKPDLLLLDLNIPKIPGLELLRILNERGIDVKVIICSCDTNFDSAKTALQYDVVYYLIKYGLTKEELLKALNKVIKLPSSPLQSSSLPPERKTIEKLEVIPDDYTSGSALCPGLVCQEYDEIINMNMISDICTQFFHSKGVECRVFSAEHIPLVLVKYPNLEEGWLNTLHDQIELMLDSVCCLGCATYHDVTVPWISDFVHVVSASAFHEQGKRILRLQMNLPVLTKASSSDFEPLFIDLTRALDTMQEERITGVLDMIFDILKSHGSDSVSSIRQVLMDILTFFSRKASTLGGNIEEIEINGYSNHFHTIALLSSFSNARLFFHSFIHKFVTAFYIPQKKSESAVVSNTLDYIDENIDKTITLSAAAEATGVTPSYLSSMFKQVMGDNFIHYVNDLKLKKASEMLLDGKSVGTVSQILGFNDVSYFSKLFKKYSGISPEQFQKSGVNDHS